MTRPVDSTRGKYAMVKTRLWADSRFAALSSAQPNAQTLWLRLLTAPERTRIPGLIVVSAPALAASLGWEVPDLLRVAGELVREGMLVHDWDPTGYPAGYPIGYPTGYPIGYPIGYPTGWVPDSRSRIPDPRSRIPDPRSQILLRWRRLCSRFAGRSGARARERARART